MLLLPHRYQTPKQSACLLAEGSKASFGGECIRLRPETVHAARVHVPPGEDRCYKASNLVCFIQAAELGRWGVARTVFEHGLRRHPKHAVMSEKLVEVLVQLNDFKAVQPALDHIFAQDPGHPRALQLKLAATSAICGQSLSDELPAKCNRPCTILFMPSNL